MGQRRIFEVENKKDELIEELGGKRRSLRMDEGPAIFD